MLTALEYLGSVGIGVTTPQLFRANDGQLYIVKLLNNPMGSKVLVNEYIACWFGLRMELCFPVSDLFEIDEQLVKKKRRLRVTEGPHFASRYLHGARYVTRHDLKKAVNKRVMAGVILFDHMFHNIDRTKNSKNLLVCREGENRVLYAIDNSHLFVRGRWNPQSIEKLTEKITVNQWRVYGWLLKNFLRTDDFIVYVEKIKGICDAELAELVESIPLKWLAKTEEREALLNYMIRRRGMVDDVVNALCQSIPNINRRTYFY